ncbi:MAG TPA: hypothetical protein PKC39_06600 [Ferruginibacter sp.]|nr:hypothetical protein [Ferruginibacter sp.]HMP20608.1 hypothetical protein [Ferruginibacter sp.]
MTTHLRVLLFTLFIYTTATAQENSPYSRYGLGDMVPNQNMINRGMGGIAAGYADYQTINFVNPASYGNLGYIDSFTLRNNPNALRNTIFDIGVEINTRTLKEGDPPQRFTATNLLVSYLQLGIPVKMRKLNKKGVFMGMSMGLRPVSRINYKVYKNGRLQDIDSLLTVYEGSGGISEANFGAGIRIKKFNLGFNTGYRFGNKDYSTRLSFINDSVTYYQSNSASKTNFGSVFTNAGMQYEITFKNKNRKPKGVLRLGAYGSLSKTLGATQDIIRETVVYDEFGAPSRIDSVFEKSVKGDIVYPAMLGFGFTYQDSSNHWLFGADFEQTYWDKYRFYNQADQVRNSWRVRVGADFFPADLRTPLKKYFSFVRYRAGFYYGNDYIDLGASRPEYGITLGFGFPLKLRKGYYETQTSILNTTLEFGSRGNKNSDLRENIFRIGFGLALGDMWFNRSKYY